MRSPEIDFFSKLVDDKPEDLMGFLDRAEKDLAEIREFAKQRIAENKAKAEQDQIEYMSPLEIKIRKQLMYYLKKKDKNIDYIDTLNNLLETVAFIDRAED